MNKRNKTILSFLLTLSMVFANMIPIYANEYSSINDTEEATILSEDEKAELAYVDVSKEILDAYVICDSEKDPDYSFAEIAPEPYRNTALVSYTDGYRENLAVFATEYTKDFYLFNNGEVLASENNPNHSDNHSITIIGYDGHGEEIYINSNFFNLNDKEINRLTLGELNVYDKYGKAFYSPVSGLVISPRSDYIDSNGNRIPMTISLDIVHNNYYMPNQTWIRVTFTNGEEGDSEDSKVISGDTEDEISKLLPKKITTSYGGYNLTVSMCEAIPYCKKKKEVVSNVKYKMEIVNSIGVVFRSGGEGFNSGGITVKKIKATKPKNGMSKVTFVLKGSGKEMRKVAKQLGKALKKIPVVVSGNSL